MLAVRLFGTLDRWRLRFAVAAVVGAVGVMSSVALAAFVSGRTSQHGVVRADIGKHDRLTGLVIELKNVLHRPPATGHRPGFAAPFRHPQDASGNVGDSYNIVGRDAATRVRFRQRASFAARLTKTLQG